MKWFSCILLLAFAITVAAGNPDAKRLYDDLLSNYNKLVRPVVNVSDALMVKIKLKLSQLIDVNLKNQIMTTNLWVEQTWYDYKLKWEPREYGGVEMLHVPSDHIWRPDIVLYNNADGNFEVTLSTKAILNYTGYIIWRPPAIYKSSCEIDVEYFPFDEQTCVMKFGSWTYDGFQVDHLNGLERKYNTKKMSGRMSMMNEWKRDSYIVNCIVNYPSATPHLASKCDTLVDLRHVDELNGTNVVEVGVDLTEFYQSVEWDVLGVPAVRNEKFYTCCDEPYLDITFNITMRRKTLFYTVNLIIPCMGISFLTILVFYLPSDSGEKVSLSISILLSLTVFFLLLAEIIPPTSLVVPLLGKFVLFTMILDTVSICVTVVVLNVHFRSPQTHTMAPWVRTVFINHLPKLLVMRRPIYPYNGLGFSEASRRFMMRTCNGLELRDQIPPLPPEIALSNFDSSLLLDHHILNVCERNMESFNMNVSCKLHGSPKTQATNRISPVHRLHSLDLMDDIPLTFCKETNTNSPILTTPIIEHNKVMTPRRQVNHQLHALNDDLSSNTTNHKNKSYGGGGGGGGIGVGSGSGCGVGNSSVCGSVNGINVLGNTAYNPMDGGMLGTSSNSHHQKQSTSASHSHYKSLHRSFSQQEPTKDDRCAGLRHRWQDCPELHKAMDGVNYIADHTRKEEESTKVKEDWKYVAMVLDRLFLWLFTIAVIVGTAGIILQAPTLYDTRVPIDIKLSEIASATLKPHVTQPIL